MDVELVRRNRSVSLLTASILLLGLSLDVENPAADAAGLGTLAGEDAAVDSLPGSYSSAALRAVQIEGAVPGLAVAVSMDGSIVWQDQAGWSDTETRDPVTPRTRFRIGSTSKAITAIALARLWQEGSIDLDADVRRYVPMFPDKGVTITPRLLAGHLAGIRNYQPKDFEPTTHIDHRHFETTRDALAIFADDPLVAPPGESYTYSVFGYTLLSAAMEGAAGESFLPMLDRLVIAPLGLRDTGPDSLDARGLAVAYERTANGGASVAEPLDFSYKWAGGGLYSSAGDLARLGSALLDPRFLSAASLDLLTTSQATRDGRLTNVALGWRLATDSRGRRFIHHAGSISGGRAVVLVYPDHDVAVAITSNQALAPLMVESTAQVLAEPFLLQREGEEFVSIRPVGGYDYTWTADNAEHTGALCYAEGRADDRIDLHPALGAWAAGLGSPFPTGGGRVLPMLLTGKEAFLPVVTPAGAFALDVRILEDDSLEGEVTGQFVRVRGPFRAVRSRDGEGCAQS